jgi:hypothetical protein
MQPTITVAAKVLGQNTPAIADWSVPVPPEWNGPGARLRLRDLITRIVLTEVEAFRQQQRRLAPFLTAPEIQQGVEQGKVIPGDRGLEQEVDAQAAVDATLVAFEAGLYFCFVDGQQQYALDDEVFLKPASKVTFIRLAASAGG